MSPTEEVTEWVAANWDVAMPLRDWWQRLSDAGFAFPVWPVGLGGRGWPATQAGAVLQALGAAGVIGPPSGIGPNMGVATVLAHGTAEQRQRFVPSVANGSVSWCQLFSEPAAGSDLAAVATRAELDGDEFIVSGQKVWNSAADVSEWGMLLARTDRDVPKHDGLTWMLIDMRQPGVEVRPLVQMNGGAEFCEVFLTEARVPLANVVGGLGNGWNVARTTLLHERGTVGQRYPKGLVLASAGSLAGNLDRSVGEVLERARRAAADPSRRFDIMVGARRMMHLAREMGRASDPVVRQRVADYWIRSEVHRLMGMRRLNGSVLKLSTAMLAHRSRDVSLAILGAEGMLFGGSARDHGRVQRAGVSAHAPSLGGGTNEIQRNIIGERVLGLPREPAADG